MNAGTRSAAMAAFALAGLLATNDARAVITDCNLATDGLTVYLSGPSDSVALFPDDQARSEFLGLLQWKLDQKLDAKWLQSPSSDVGFTTCGGRLPKMDGTEPSSSQIEKMNDRGVVLEIWGRFAKTPPEGGTPAPYAQINYLLVPVRFAADRDGTKPNGLERLEYRAEPTTESPDFVALVAQPRDIGAFVSAAFGFKLLLNGDFEPAHRQLCRANALLGDMTKQDLPAKTKADVAALRASVVQWAARAIDEAKKSTKYDKLGTLRMQDSSDPCAGGE